MNIIHKRIIWCFSVLSAIVLLGVVLFVAQGGRAEVTPRSLDLIQGLEYGTYLGGTGDDWIEDLAVGVDGSIYITGGTYSEEFGMAGTAIDDADVFVAKISGDGQTLEYVQIFGGGGEDVGKAIAVDDEGNAFITGYTYGGSFPVTNNAFDTSFNGGQDDAVDGFVVQLDALGEIAYSTFLGGSGYMIPPTTLMGGIDMGYGIAVVGEYVYITGSTESSDFPVSSGAYDTTYANISSGMTQDAFVVKMRLVGQGAADLQYGTFLGGGGGSEIGHALQVDAAGSIYVVGSVGNDFAGEFPRTSGAVDMVLEVGDTDGFLVVFEPAGLGNEDLVYATLLGGYNYDIIHDLILDDDNSVYMVGETGSPDFLTTAGAFDTSCGTDMICNYIPNWGVYSDAFVTWIDPDPEQSALANLRYSTYLGGSDFENGIGWGDIQLVESGEVIVAGCTRSIDTFPTTEAAYARQLAGSSFDTFAARLQLDGNGQNDLVYGTYFGGTGIDHAYAIAVGPTNTIWIAGETQSDDLPTSTDALFVSHNGGSGFHDDGFLARLATIAEPDLSASYMRVNPEIAVNGDMITYTIGLVNSGNLTTTVNLEDNLPGTLLLVGTPEASEGTADVNASQISWGGEISPATTVRITFTAQVDLTNDANLSIVNDAWIDDGTGNSYLRRTILNAEKVFGPLIDR